MSPSFRRHDMNFLLGALVAVVVYFILEYALQLATGWCLGLAGLVGIGASGVLNERNGSREDTASEVVSG